MSPLRQEIHDCIDSLPDSKLEALQPLLTVLVNDTITVENDLTNEEKEIIRQGRAEYGRGGYVSLDSVQ